MAQRPQLLKRRAVGPRLLQRGQHYIRRPRCRDQQRQLIGLLPLDAQLAEQRLQPAQVLLPDQRQQLPSDVGILGCSIQHPLHKPLVGQRQNALPAQLLQAEGSQRQNLARFPGADGAQALHAGLHDLPVFARARIRPVDVFVVLHPHHIGAPVGLDDAQRHIRPQRQQPAARIGKREHRIRHQKILVAGV